MTFNGQRLEVIKIWQNFYLGRSAQQKFACLQEAQEVSTIRSRLT